MPPLGGGGGEAHFTQFSQTMDSDSTWNSVLEQISNQNILLESMFLYEEGPKDYIWSRCTFPMRGQETFFECLCSWYDPGILRVHLRVS